MSNICVGRPIIEILAKEGAWCNSEGDCVIAADDLHGSNPYAEIDRLRYEAERWKHVAENKWSIDDLQKYQEEIDRLRARNAELEQFIIGVADRKEEIDRLRAENAELREALNDLLNDCINFDGGKLTDVFQERATAILAKTTKEEP